MPAREANGRYIYRSRDMKKKIAGIILQAARIYSKPFRQASGWRSDVGAYCKLNWCAVYILTVCMLLCTVCETFASSRTGTPVTPAASEAAGPGTELSDSEPELSEPKPENPKPEPSGPEGETREGWVKAGTKTYFFRDGKKQTGWQKTKGKWQTCDCSMRRVDKKNNFFLVDRKTYASLVKIKWGSTVRWDSIYTMHVKKGKVNWASKENFI